MIILEFRFKENFNTAFKILKGLKIPFTFEVSMVEWRSNLIFFFEDAIQTLSQREALRRARNFEKVDRSQQKCFPGPNLAVPL